MPDFTLRWHTHLVPKEGHTEEECEDAVDGNVAAARFAIADGASESYAAGDWARLLVETFLERGPADNWLARPRMAWKQQTASHAVSWYAEEKFKLGAHATFLGVSIEGSEWHALACGDACLFVLSRGSLLKCFPMTRAGDFSSRPDLVGSRGGNSPWHEDHGQLSPGDVLILTTDALAQFLLQSEEEGPFAGRDLTGMENADDFAMWVAMMRSSGKLRNDDVAIGVIRLASAR